MAVDFKVKDKAVYRSVDGGTWTEFIIKGVNVRGSGYSDGVWTPDSATFTKIVTNWGYNTLRISVIADPYDSNTGVSVNSDGVVSWSGGFEKDLKALINKCFAGGIRVVQLCPRFNGSKGAGLNIKPLGTTRSNNYDVSQRAMARVQQFWKYWADQYKGDPRVWFNLFNEPITEGGQLADSYKEIIKVIRDKGANNIIILDSKLWGQDVNSSGSTTYPTNQSWIMNYAKGIVNYAESLSSNKPHNIVFAIHCYGAGWRGSNNYSRTAAQLKADTKTRAKDAIAKFRTLSNPQICFHCGEYNVNDMENNGLEKQQVGDQFTQDKEAAMTDGLVEAFIDLHVWTVPWMWSNPGGEPDSGPINGKGSNGADIKFDRNNNPTNLSRMGKIMWKDVKRTFPSPRTTT